MREAVRFVLAHAATSGESRRSGVAYNPLSARVAQDPDPVYAALLRRGPVHRGRLLNARLLPRHADVDAILRSHRRSDSDPCEGRLTRVQRAMLPPPEEFTMLSLDPPGHTWLGALTNKAFTSRAMNALEARNSPTAAALLDEIHAAAEFDSRAYRWHVSPFSKMPAAGSACDAFAGKRAWRSVVGKAAAAGVPRHVGRSIFPHSHQY